MGVNGPCSDTPRKSPQVLEAGPKKVGVVSPAADVDRDDMWARRAVTSPKRATSPGPTQFLPVPAATATVVTNESRRSEKALSESNRTPQRRPSWLDDDLPPT